MFHEFASTMLPPDYGTWKAFWSFFTSVTVIYLFAQAGSGRDATIGTDENNY